MTLFQSTIVLCVKPTAVHFAPHATDSIARRSQAARLTMSLNAKGYCFETAS